MTARTGLGARLRQLLARLDGDVQQVYDELGVPFRPRYFPIVQVLLEQGDARVGALAEAIGVSQPAATQTLAEMTKAGLVELSVGDDRRERRVALSPLGRQLAVRLEPVWAAVDAAAAGVDGELTRPLSSTLDDALAALDRKPFRDRVQERMIDG